MYAYTVFKAHIEYINRVKQMKQDNKEVLYNNTRGRCTINKSLLLSER